MANAPSAGGSHDYALSSDLARLSLPAEYVDSYRNLAWTNSICFLFLVIGLIGLKAPAQKKSVDFAGNFSCRPWPAAAQNPNS
jgi:hypothetical protein